MFKRRFAVRRSVCAVGTAVVLTASLAVVSSVTAVGVSCDGAEPSANVTVAESSGEFTTAFGQVQTTQYTPTTEAIAAEPLLLDEGRVRVLCVLDEEARDIPVFTLQPEQVDLASVARNVLGDSAVRTSGTSNFHTAECSLTLDVQSGKVSMNRRGLAAAGALPKLGFEAAQAIADDFISVAGGLPLGYRLVSVSGVPVEEITARGEQEPLGMRSFWYGTAMEGMPVLAPGRIGVCVTVVADQVYMYRRWTPLLIDGDSSQQILSAEAALDIAAPRLRSAFSSAPIRDSVDIVEVQLVYFSPTPLDYAEYGIDQLRPAYSLKADGENLPIHIDAVDGSILSQYD